MPLQSPLVAMHTGILFRHKRLRELDDLSGRTTGRLGYIRAYTATRIRGPHCDYEPDNVLLLLFYSSLTTCPDRQLASLTGQCRQVYCLVEMVPSAPSWRPPHQRGEFDGFPGQREGPNQCRHTRSFQAFSTYSVLRRSRRRRIAPSDPSLTQPSRQSPAACPE